MGKKRKSRMYHADHTPGNIHTYLLEQFGLSKKVKQPRRWVRWKEVKMKPSFVVYVSLFMGLFIGIGSSFANKEVPPSVAPPDQPVYQKSEELPKEVGSKEAKPSEVKSEEQKSQIMNSSQTTPSESPKSDSPATPAVKEEDRQGPSVSALPTSPQGGVGGKLPNTAGNDLNGVLIGFILTTSGLILLCARKQSKKVAS